jgi:hypothetical protein
MLLIEPNSSDTMFISTYNYRKASVSSLFARMPSMWHFRSFGGVTLRGLLSRRLSPPIIAEKLRSRLYLPACLLCGILEALVVSL